MPHESEQMDSTYPAVMAFLDRHFVQHMAECGGYSSPCEWCFPLACFTNEWITRDMARAVLRSLTDRGYCQYRRGLFNEDGEVAGSGYGLTQKGVDYYQELCPLVGLE